MTIILHDMLRRGTVMWEFVIVVAQLACLALLIAGAGVSLWFWRLASPPPPGVEPESPPVSASEAVAATEAVARSIPPLKRAA